MKFNVKIGEGLSEVKIDRNGPRVLAEIDGREYELEASQPEPNVFLLKHGADVYEVYISPAETRESPVTARSGCRELEVTVIDPKRLRGSAAGGRETDGIAEIRAQMPGKVVRILAREGEEVSKDEGVMVIEAMKMQNEIRSVKKGVVKEIRFAEGETVNAGDVLVVIE